jgi:hypothetical protein
MFFRRTAACWIATVAALATVSCAKQDQTAVSSDSNPESSAASGTATGGTSRLPEEPAEIQLPMEESPSNLDSLRASLDAKHFYHGPLHYREIPAYCTDKTITGGCIAGVTIQAIGLSKDIKADSGPARGRVIGEIRNLDSVDVTKMDSLKPQSRATYYIYMDRAASGHARWSLLEVPATHTGSIHRVIQNEVRACGERPGYTWAHSDVDLSNCGRHALAEIHTAQLLTATGWLSVVGRVERYLRALTASERTKWYGCTGGCCI